MANVKLSKSKIAIIIVAAVLFILLAAGGIYCVATEQSPASAVTSMFSNEEKLIGKWQSQKAPGMSAYVFYDDGTYDSYLSTITCSWSMFEVSRQFCTIDRRAKRILSRI